MRQTKNIRHFECRVLVVRTVGNIFRMGSSSNSSFTTKPCACLYVAFLAGNISWAVDSNYSCHLYSFVDCRKRSCEFTYRINSNAEYVHSSNDSPLYRGADKSLARPTSRCILFDGENISFDTSRVTYVYLCIYTGCPRRKGQNFGRVFLTLNYTDITQNTYIQS